MDKLHPVTFSSPILIKTLITTKTFLVGKFDKMYMNFLSVEMPFFLEKYKYINIYIINININKKTYILLMDKRIITS